MTRGILIVGNESSLFSAAAAEAAKRVTSFVTVPVPNRFPIAEGAILPKTETIPKAIPLSWNPSNSISARTLILAAENRLQQIDNAIVVCSPPAVFKSAQDLTPEEIEILVTDHIKGWLYLIRELVQYFNRRGSGSLHLVAPEIPVNKNSQADLLGPSALASFRSFAQGVITSQAGAGFQVMGFTTAEAGDEADFAAWFFRIIDEAAAKNSGRWHRYSKIKFFR